MHPYKILLVDDDVNLLAAIRRQLRKNYDLHFAQGGAKGLEIIASEGPFAVVISDMQMPEMNGIEFLSQVKERNPESVRVMLTGNADMQTAIDAVNEGKVYRFFSKPCSMEELSEGIDEGIQRYKLVTAEKDLLEKTVAGSVKVLTDILAMMEPASFGTSHKVRHWVHDIMPLFQGAIRWQLDLAVMLAPLGLAAVPHEVLVKMKSGEKLTDVEQEIITKIPEIGRNLIQNIPRLEPVAEIVYFQNKGFDGSGFPDGPTSGTDIPMGARILKIMNDLALTTQGLYPTVAAFDYLYEKQSLYDPQLLPLIRKGLLQLKKKHKDEHNKNSIIRDVPLSSIRPGYILQSDVCTISGRLILASGYTLSMSHIERLRNINKIEDIQEPILVLMKVYE